MNLRSTRMRATAGAAATLALSATAIALVADGAASAAATTHTLTVTTRQLQDKIVRGVDVATDADLQKGVVTGYDVTSCRVDPETHVARCDVAVARAAGLLYGHARINLETGRGHGTVTGGTRHFRGASGTITVRGNRVTIKWSN